VFTNVSRAGLSIRALADAIGSDRALGHRDAFRAHIARNRHVWRLVNCDPGVRIRAPRSGRSPLCGRGSGVRRDLMARASPSLESHAPVFGNVPRAGRRAPAPRCAAMDLAEPNRERQPRHLRRFLRPRAARPSTAGTTRFAARPSSFQRSAIWCEGSGLAGRVKWLAALALLRVDMDRARERCQAPFVSVAGRPRRFGRSQRRPAWCFQYCKHLATSPSLRTPLRLAGSAPTIASRSPDRARPRRSPRRGATQGRRNRRLERRPVRWIRQRAGLHGNAIETRHSLHRHLQQQAGVLHVLGGSTWVATFGCASGNVPESGEG